MGISNTAYLYVVMHVPGCGYSCRMSIALKQTHVARRYVDLLRVDSTLMCWAR